MSLNIRSKTDTVAFLPNWKDSPGSREEHKYAVKNGKKIIYLEG
jgi:hypothetical protein